MTVYQGRFAKHDLMGLEEHIKKQMNFELYMEKRDAQKSKYVNCQCYTLYIVSPVRRIGYQA